MKVTIVDCFFSHGSISKSFIEHGHHTGFLKKYKHFVFWSSKAKLFCCCHSYYEINSHLFSFKELLALRSQDVKAKKRVAAMLKQTKAANKAAIEDAVDNENTAVTLGG